jgi:hypothetical protein
MNRTVRRFGDRRDHRQAGAPRADAQHGGLPPQRVPAMARLGAVQAGLIPPADLGPLGPRLTRDLRLFHAPPARHRLIVALVGSPRRPLGSHPPSLRVQPDRANRHRNSEAHPEQLLHRASRPEGKGQLELIGTAAAESPQRPGLLLRGQVSPRPLRPPSARDHPGQGRVLRRLARQGHAVRPRVPGDPTYLGKCLPVAPQREHLPAQFCPRLATDAPTIQRSHTPAIARFAWIVTSIMPSLTIMSLTKCPVSGKR